MVRWATFMRLKRTRLRLRSLRPALATFALTALSLASCSVGQGEGFAEGRIRLDDCAVNLASYAMRPNFFGADYIESPGDIDGETRMVNLQMQRGSYREGDSDGIYIFVRDVNLIGREGLGMPIDLAPTTGVEPLVHMTFYANQTCESGQPREFWRIPGVLPAVSGTITFDAVRAEDVPGSGDAFIGHFENVVFQSPDDPVRRNAELNGAFSFFFQRGAPAQRFP